MLLIVVIAYVVLQGMLAPIAFGAMWPAEGSGPVVWGVFFFIVVLWVAVPVAIFYFWSRRSFLEVGADGVRFRVVGRAFRRGWGSIAEVRVSEDGAGKALGVELGGMPGVARTVTIPMRSFDVPAAEVIDALAAASSGGVEIRALGPR